MYLWREIVCAVRLERKRRKLCSVAICADMVKDIRSKHSVLQI